MVMRACLLAALMSVNYCVAVLNTRAIAQMRYGWTAATDAAICILNFTIIQRVAEAQTPVEQIGYTIGGVGGALAGLWLSRRWT